MNVLVIVLGKDTHDVDITKATLETLNLLCTAADLKVILIEVWVM